MKFDMKGTIMQPFKPKQNHKAVGERSEAIIIARLIEVGYNVYLPFGDNLRCDLIIEDADEKLWRVQCKTGWLQDDGACIEFKTASSYYHTRAGKMGYSKKDYRGQIDFFASYCPNTKGVYLIPVDHVPLTKGRLRLIPTENNQEKNVRWAKDYEL